MTSSRQPRESPAQRKKRAAAIYRGLLKLYPDAHCALRHRNPFELIIATILSAQCTDKRVNMVTPDLFARYPDAAAMAKASQPDLEAMVRTTGFFRSKAKSIKGTSEQITRDFGGKVPDTMEDLLTLPGVARKTANVVLGNAFGKNEGVVVDTHVARLSRRLGLTEQGTPSKIEMDLQALFPRDRWTMLAHLLIFHGRSVCVALRPRCDACTLAGLCPKIGVVGSRNPQPPEIH